ncbi:MAG: hypothetical protein CLLPBCKN_007504 [Chroococcidiopsis cubana SAG 39.79]|uniref:Uncharacterized protein n=1 Tax=Chroococcidiopsis cubana SAG 39.79 TaxID=388085 RepID=A0AB37UV89_9CYAN|nr:hypothetical protein [Chroococcidiopsis cubana]MDZ4878069.1 hypothetical protein [Chroococcidiopsis cubana SAG 39.79]RUT14652.1 hypothetical protein DSM107010_01980 [Chroococcidiopsis cubana SAG 39.79]
MHEHRTEAQTNSDSQASYSSLYKLVNNVLSMMVMFAACLLICHTPSLMNAFLGHFSH